MIRDHDPDVFITRSSPGGTGRGWDLSSEDVLEVPPGAHPARPPVVGPGRRTVGPPIVAVPEQLLGVAVDRVDDPRRVGRSSNSGRIGPDCGDRGEHRADPRRERRDITTEAPIEVSASTSLCSVITRSWTPRGQPGRLSSLVWHAAGGRTHASGIPRGKTSSSPRTRYPGMTTRTEPPDDLEGVSQPPCLPPVHRETPSFPRGFGDNCRSAAHASRPM